MHKLLLVPIAVAWTLVVASAAVASVETITLFDPAARETPESIQIDRHGNIYVSFLLTGEIRKIAPDGTQSTLAFLPLHPESQPCQNSLGMPTLQGIARDHQGNTYASVNSCNAEDLGIWKVTPDGQQSLLAELPGSFFPPGRSWPNGIAYHDGWLYVADSFQGLVWRAHSDGQSPVEIWSDDPLLKPLSNSPPGSLSANGLQIFKHKVYVSVSARQHIVALRIKSNGSAGPGRVHAAARVDDFAFDVKGNPYGSGNHMVIRVTRDGTSEILLTSADGLDIPTSAAFGVKDDRRDLYVANGAFPFIPRPEPRRPSVIRLHIGIPGKPRP
jgi:sugar lactone lactonase YvrE